MAEAGVNTACQNLTRQEVEEETTGMYAWRVLAGSIRPSAPYHQLCNAKRQWTGQIDDPVLVGLI